MKNFLTSIYFVLILFSVPQLEAISLISIKTHLQTHKGKYLLGAASLTGLYLLSKPSRPTGRSGGRGPRGMNGGQSNAAMAAAAAAATPALFGGRGSGSASSGSTSYDNNPLAGTFGRGSGSGGGGGAASVDSDYGETEFTEVGTVEGNQYFIIGPGRSGKYYIEDSFFNFKLTENPRAELCFKKKNKNDSRVYQSIKVVGVILTGVICREGLNSEDFYFKNDLPAGSQGIDCVCITNDLELKSLEGKRVKIKAKNPSWNVQLVNSLNADIDILDDCVDSSDSTSGGGGGGASGAPNIDDPDGTQYVVTGKFRDCRSTDRTDYYEFVNQKDEVQFYMYNKRPELTGVSIGKTISIKVKNVGVVNRRPLMELVSYSDGFGGTKNGVATATNDVVSRTADGSTSGGGGGDGAAAAASSAASDFVPAVPAPANQDGKENASGAAAAASAAVSESEKKSVAENEKPRRISGTIVIHQSFGRSYLEIDGILKYLITNLPDHIHDHQAVTLEVEHLEGLSINQYDRIRIIKVIIPLKEEDKERGEDLRSLFGDENDSGNGGGASATVSSASAVGAASSAAGGDSAPEVIPALANQGGKENDSGAAAAASVAKVISPSLEAEKVEKEEDKERGADLRSLFGDENDSGNGGGASANHATSASSNHMGY